LNFDDQSKVLIIMRDRIMLTRRHLDTMTHAWNDWVPGMRFSVHPSPGPVEIPKKTPRKPGTISITKPPDEPPFWDSDDSKYERKEDFISPYDKVRD